MQKKVCCCTSQPDEVSTEFVGTPGGGSVGRRIQHQCRPYLWAVLAHPTSTALLSAFFRGWWHPTSKFPLLVLGARVDVQPAGGSCGCLAPVEIERSIQVLVPAAQTVSRCACPASFGLARQASPLHWVWSQIGSRASILGIVPAAFVSDIFPRHLVRSSSAAMNMYA